MSETSGDGPQNGQIAAVGDQAPANTDPTAAQARQPSAWESTFSMVKSLAIRALVVYFIMTWFKKPVPPATNSTSGAVVAPMAARNIFTDGTPISLHVYLAESDPIDFSNAHLFWFKEGLVYGDWTSGKDKDGSFSVERNVPISQSMKNNGSLFLHAFVTRDGQSPDPAAPNYAKKYFTTLTKQLNKYKKLKNSGTKNLLTGATEAVVVEEGKVISHWHPNFTINLIADQTAWTFGSVPSPLDTFVVFTEDKQFYKPVLYGNDFWNMAKDYSPLNETYTLRVTFQPLSLFKWQMYAAQGMRQSWNVWGENEQSDEDQDTLKETLMDTNPYLLGITMAVSLLHSVFELLAFKNDIQFWNKRDSLEGLSVRSVFFNVFQSLIVLLYVMDNETNTLVRISCFVGLGIELWKIYKVVDIRFENGWIRFEDKGSYVESSTKIYDQLAYKYLSWLCFPLLACYCGYSLLYVEHKGWYSFVLNILYGYLLTFGFIMMTPQLFINYKLKSVAHLPWRMLTYKFLNTFIDDMFAFVIKMPTMYRLGCFRDDIVFLIFLYQKWIYPVDKSRRNEFGYSEEPPKDAIEGSQESEGVVVEAKKDK